MRSAQRPIVTSEPADVRKACQAYAQKYIDVQREQFKRLGIFAMWDRPYTTMSPVYEASQLEVFAKFVEAGLVFKKLRPVPWSTTNQTALAERWKLLNGRQLAPDLLDVFARQEPWIARVQGRVPRSRNDLAKLIDESVVREARES